MGEICLLNVFMAYSRTQSEYDSLLSTLEGQGVVEKLKREGSYLARTDPADVARAEDRTYICR